MGGHTSATLAGLGRTPHGHCALDRTPHGVRLYFALGLEEFEAPMVKKWNTQPRRQGTKGLLGVAVLSSVSRLSLLRRT